MRQRDLFSGLSAPRASVKAWFTLFVAMVMVGLSAGCNEAADPVNRVQPNVMKKEMFVGEWHYLQTVIDTPYSAGYTFVGEQGSLNKIEWEIQEDYLIARRAYEFIAGAEPEGLGEASEQNAPIAMYRIESHFDITRQYNPVTGEEQNVIYENTSDRPWHERDYMRVDWSQNLVTDSNFLVGAKIFNAISTEPAQYYVQDLEHPHAPKFEANENGEVEYMDIVNKMIVKPESVYFEGYGAIPVCYLLYQSHLDCSPGEITVRNSFLKVNEDARDYSPQDYTGDRMEKFGYFNTERPGYDDQYGVVEQSRFRFANRHNIWQQSHKRDADGNVLRCTEATADVCGGGGSECNVDYGKAHRDKAEDGSWLGACTIPYREREVRPIAYHVSKNFPESLFGDAVHFGHEWNRAFVETVSSLRENECLADGGDAATCAAERTREDHQNMFVVCHNPVVAEDHAACGPEGTSANIGDLRQNLIGWVAEPHLMSPLGYGPSAADPETGEIIMANAFVYGAAMDTLTTYARDILALLNGDVTEQEIMDGSLVDDWVLSQQAPQASMALTAHEGHAHGADYTHGINTAMDFSWAQAFAPTEPVSFESPVDALDALEMARGELSRMGTFGVGGDARARLNQLIGTDIEARMTNDEMMTMAGFDPFLPQNQEAIAMASPLRGNSPDLVFALDQARNLIQREACILNADFADDGLIGLARAIKDAVDNGDGTMEWYGVSYDLTTEDGSLDYAKVRDMLRHPIFDAVTAHEVGHTLGLRHNFSGSFDAMNYHPRYWELRDDGNMLPRLWDPMTEDEINGRITEYQYSTVMDYGHNFVVTDAEGIGHYDVAAIKMGYGDLVEVFTDMPDRASVEALSWYNVFSSLGWPVAITGESLRGGDLRATPYTEFPAMVGGRENLEKRADVPYESLTYIRELALSWPEPLGDQQGRPLVPYMFCSDEQADLGPDCLRYDMGADPYETMASVEQSYSSYYIFNAYRRGRIGFNTGSYANRIFSRYFSKLQYANQLYSLYRPIFGQAFGGRDNLLCEGPSADPDVCFFTRPDGMGAYTAAVGLGYDTFRRVATTPEPGEYALTTRPDGDDVYAVAGAGDNASVSISGFDGRALETTWNQDAGYYWFDQLERAGFFYDKIYAMFALTDPQTRFLGRDTASDERRYLINYANSFGPSLNSFFRGMLGEDWTSVAPRVDGAGKLTFPTALELEGQNMAGVPVDPNASFTVQMYAAVLSMGLIPETFDRDFQNRSRIFLEGGAESVGLAPGTPTVRFTDPRSGLTYVAVSYMDGPRETGVGAELLTRANALLAATGVGTAAERAAATAELNDFVQNVDLVRRLSWMYNFHN